MSSPRTAANKDQWPRPLKATSLRKKQSLGLKGWTMSPCPLLMEAIPSRALKRYLMLKVTAKPAGLRSWGNGVQGAGTPALAQAPDHPSLLGLPGCC